MEINSISNFTPNTNQNPAFTSIKMIGSAGDTLKRVLKPEEWEEFKEISEFLLKNENVDITIAGRHNSNRLKALLEQNKTNFIDNFKTYTQYPWEKTMSFIRRIKHNACVDSVKIRKLKNINPDEIVQKFTK